MRCVWKLWCLAQTPARSCPPPLAPRPSLPRESLLQRRGPVGAYLPPAGRAEWHLAPPVGQHRGSCLRLASQVGFPTAQALQSQPVPHGSLWTPGLSTPEKGGPFRPGPSFRLSCVQVFARIPPAAPHGHWLLPASSSSSFASSFSPTLSRCLLQGALGASVHPEMRSTVTGTLCLSHSPVTPF